jgi:hypothetical protein
MVRAALPVALLAGDPDLEIGGQSGTKGPESYSGEETCNGLRPHQGSLTPASITTSRSAGNSDQFAGLEYDGATNSAEWAMSISKRQELYE